MRTRARVHISRFTTCIWLLTYFAPFVSLVLHTLFYSFNTEIIQFNDYDIMMNFGTWVSSSQVSCRQDHCSTPSVYTRIRDIVHMIFCR